MPGGRLALAEHRDGDGLDVFEILVEFRNVVDLVLAIPLVDIHAAPTGAEIGVYVGDDLLLARLEDVEDLIDLALIVRRELLELPHARIPVGQQVDQQVERRKQPGEQAVAEEIAAEQRPVLLVVAHHVDDAADEEYGRQNGDEVKTDRQHQNGDGDFAKGFAKGLCHFSRRLGAILFRYGRLWASSASTPLASRCFGNGSIPNVTSRAPRYGLLGRRTMSFAPRQRSRRRPQRPCVETSYINGRPAGPNRPISRALSGHRPGTRNP